MAKQKKENIIINYVNVKPVNRKALDIRNWRDAIKSAESSSHNRVNLFDIYDEILLDGHLESIVQKRIDAITNLQIQFFNDKQEPVDEINSIVKKGFFEKLLIEIILAKFWGYSLIELDWSSVENYNNQTYSINRRHVKKELGIVVKNPSDTSGVSYIDHPFAFLCDTEKHGLLAQAAPLVIYKRNNNSDWAEYNEVYGKPYPMGTYENDETAALLTDAFDKAGFDAYIVAPKDATIELHQSNQGGGSGLFKDFSDSKNEELSILILGQNLTTKAVSGSYAASKTHSEVEESRHTADRDFVLRILNEKVCPILRNLGFNAIGSFTFIYADEIELTDRIAIDTQLSNIIEIEPEYFYETYKIPKPNGTTRELKNRQKEGNEKKQENNSFIDKLKNTFIKKKRPLEF